MYRHTRHLLLLLAVLPSAGCHRYLVATPNVLVHQDARLVYADCADECRTPDAEVLYATDRTVDDDGKSYGYGRSKSLVFGVATVDLQPHPTWNEFILDSTNAKRRDYEVKLAGVRELGPVKPAVDAGGAVVQSSAPGLTPFQELLQSRLAQAPHKDVYIFVHGFNNGFDDGVIRAAEVWHFMGRVGVPISYSWPAGRGGIRGYAYDRESGEFTVGHLRKFLQVVAACPDVERVHLVAHSRGCDVAISALRELHLMFTANGKATQQELKLENVVLAAPDVDEEVFLQRFIGEHVLEAAKRTTIYASDNDRAIELSDLVFASRRRLGILAVKDFNPKMKHALARMPNVQFVECKLTGMWIGHSYIFTNPAALSDLILVLRERRPPGAEHGRPLRQPAEGLWELTDDYLR